jgi:type III pantothenate kinase
MSGGTFAIAGAVEHQHRRLRERCAGAEPLLLMTGGAAVKLAPILEPRFETVETLLLEGLLEIQSRRLRL